MKLRLVLAAAISLLCFPAIAQSAPDRGPNVLYIVSDDHGYNDLGCTNSGVLTPHLDRLAREGVRLTSFYVSWPACTPSRAAALTGRYPQRNGIYDMIRNEAPDYGYKYPPAEYEVTFERIGGMDERELIIPRFLKSRGYASAIFGKWDLGSLRRYLPLQRGFDQFYGLVNTGIDYYTHERYGVPSMYRDNALTTADKGTYATDLFKREALRFLREVERQPWFLYLPFNAPHGSSSLDPKIRGTVQAPQEFKKLYPAPKAEHQEKTNKRTGETELTVTDEARLRDYRAAVTCMDAAIGEVLAHLDKTGQARDTLVIFHSDNGGSGGADNTPLRGRKGQMFEGGLRVPCVIRWPARIPAGRVCDEFLTTLDILPTILAATGASAPSGLKLDGFDMLPCLRGEAKSPREQVFWQRQADSAARWRNFKWISSRGKESLFDLSVDLSEKTDLAKSDPETLRQMRERFAAWRQEMDAAEPRGPFRDF